MESTVENEKDGKRERGVHTGLGGSKLDDRSACLDECIASELPSKTVVLRGRAEEPGLTASVGSIVL